MTEEAEPHFPDVRFEAVDARQAAAVTAVTAYFAELDARFVGGFDPGDAITADAAHYDPPAGAFVLARVGDEVVGCGALQAMPSEPSGARAAEIKRMWVDPAWRGRGIAGRLLRDLEDRAAAAGYEVVRLDTNAVLVEAIAMYERHGYRRIDRYNQNPYAQRWFEKVLQPPPDDRKHCHRG
jgi:ribosomal protein S18 acetylase RimI-like enzyme